jgi:hypothetical protein
MIVTARPFTLEDLFAEFNDFRLFNNWQNCPLCEKLQELMAENAYLEAINDKTTPRKTVEDFEQWVFAHPTEAVPYICKVIWVTHRYHPPEIAENVQTAYAWQLTQYPWEQVQPQLEQLLHDESIPVGIKPPAMRILLGIVRQHHPNAVNFLAQPRIIRKIPKDIDIDKLDGIQNRDFQHKHPRGQALRGQHSGEYTPHEFRDLTSAAAKARLARIKEIRSQKLKDAGNGSQS